MCLTRRFSSFRSASAKKVLHYSPLKTARTRKVMSVNDRFVFDVTPFYFLRHGETPESQSGILQGQTETELNAMGRKAAEKAAAHLVGITLRSIYASPLKRAWQTASILSTLTGVPAHSLPGLMERHWGIYEGRPKSERPATPNPETVETMEDFSNRILDIMRSISGPAPFLIIAHSGVFRVLARHAGLYIDASTNVGNAQLLLLDPSGGTGSGWRISEV